ncbi:MAG: polymer-forming cytoskeletal protein [Deltaproteobacteria bacterium]|nr:polymer-forming cytoskeletal protein [Deltaproteobacteria bacterium]
MHPPAYVKADITTQALVVQDGAVFEGNCSMGKKANAESANASLYDFPSQN